jgi:hypothetical protein
MAFPCLRRGMVHLVDTVVSCVVGIPESERVESSSKDDDLPGASFDGSRQSIFRKPASRGGEQASNAGQGVLVRKLKHIPFIFTQNLHCKRVMED